VVAMKKLFVLAMMLALTLAVTTPALAEPRPIPGYPAQHLTADSTICSIKNKYYIRITPSIYEPSR
jgi:hypothetical protein